MKVSEEVRNTLKFVNKLTIRLLDKSEKVDEPT